MSRSRWLVGPGDPYPVSSALDAVQDVVREDLPDDLDLADLVGRPSDEVPGAGRAAVPRIRPILVALAARAAGARQVDGETLYAAELLHLALGVHDVALGRQGGRRRRVARKVVQRSVSWLSGNHLTVRALELCRHGGPDVLSELVDTLRSFSDGQELTRELQRGAVPTPEDWLEHADAFTGALFSFCCRAGAHLARAEPPVVSALGRYGRHLGRLWHVAEDLAVLEHSADAAPLVERAAVARPMRVVVAAAERDPIVGAAWIDLVREPDPARAAALAPRLLQLGRGPARETMAREAWSARRALRSLPESRYRVTMDRLAASLVR